MIGIWGGVGCAIFENGCAGGKLLALRTAMISAYVIHHITVDAMIAIRPIKTPVVTEIKSASVCRFRNHTKP